MLKRAAAEGDTSAAIALLQRLHFLHPGDQAPARWVSARADSSNLSAVTRLFEALREAGAHEQAAVLAARAAADASLGDPSAVVGLLHELRKAGAQEQAAVLAARAAAEASLTRCAQRAQASRPPP